MKITLVLLGSFSLAAAVFGLLGAHTVMDQVLAGVAFLAFAIFACAGSIIGSIERESKRQRDVLEEISHNTRPQGAGKHVESTVQYRIPGIND